MLMPIMQRQRAGSPCISSHHRSMPRVYFSMRRSMTDTKQSQSDLLYIICRHEAGWHMHKDRSYLDYTTRADLNDFNLEVCNPQRWRDTPPLLCTLSYTYIISLCTASAMALYLHIAFASILSAKELKTPFMMSLFLLLALTSLLA